LTTAKARNQPADEAGFHTRTDVIERLEESKKPCHRPEPRAHRIAHPQREPDRGVLERPQPARGFSKRTYL
jgi:hypothetical protein